VLGLAMGLGLPLTVCLSCGPQVAAIAVEFLFFWRSKMPLMPSTTVTEAAVDEVQEYEHADDLMS
jgi:hypothetical protein